MDSEIDRRRDLLINDWSLVCGFVSTYAEIAGDEALPTIERICRDPFWSDQTCVESALKGTQALVQLRSDA
jgi:hypothetical protein